MRQAPFDDIPILEFCPSKITDDSFNLDRQPRLTASSNTIRHVHNRVTAIKPCYGKFHSLINVYGGSNEIVIFS